MFLHLSVSHSVHRGVSVAACITGHMTGGSLSRGLCPGVSVQRVSVQGDLCWRESLSRGVSVQERSLSRRVSVQRGLCPGGLSPGGSLSRGVSAQGVSVWGGRLSRGSLSRGSLSGRSLSEGLCPGGLCPGGSLSRRVSVRETPFRRETPCTVTSRRYTSYCNAFLLMSSVSKLLSF